MFTLRNQRLPMLVGTISLCSVLQAHAEGFTINDFGVGLTASDSSIDDHESVGFFITSSPFANSHEVSIGAASSSGRYEFEWDRSFGSFLIETSQILHDVPIDSAWSRGSGQMIFESTTDLLLDLSAFYTYQGLGPEFRSVLSVDVVDRSVSPIFHYLNFGESGGPAVLGAPSGSFSTSLQALLPANHSFRVTYNFLLDTGAGGTSAVGSADGGLSFTLTAIPEPSVCAHLLPFAVALLYRRKRG